MADGVGVDWRREESKSALSRVISVLKISLRSSRIRVVVDLVDVLRGVDVIGGCGVGGGGGLAETFLWPVECKDRMVAVELIPAEQAVEVQKAAELRQVEGWW